MLFKNFFNNYETSLPVIVLFIYNFVISTILYKQEELPWIPNALLTTDKKYAEKIGIEVTTNLTTRAFGVIFCFCNFLFPSMMMIPVVSQNVIYQKCLLPGLLWNMHTFVSFLNNSIEMIYDSYKLNIEYTTLFKLISTTTFLLGLHMLLILESLIFYDQMSIKSTLKSDKFKEIKRSNYENETDIYVKPIAEPTYTFKTTFDTKFQNSD